MNINVDFTFDLTSVNTDTGTPELFVVTSSEFGDGEILETVPVDLFDAIDAAFDAYYMDDNQGVDREGQSELLKIVAYLEEVADYAREAYSNTRVVGAVGYTGYKTNIIVTDGLDG